MLDYINLHMKQHKGALVTTQSQPADASLAATFVSWDVSRLARAEREHLFKGLERFVNADDSLKEYKALSRGWRDFWPFDLQDGHARPLAWADECHLLFLVCRDALRRVWISDPVALQGGMVSFLLGLSGWKVSLPYEARLVLARDKIERAYPGASEIGHPIVFPHWKGGAFNYSPDNDFHRALYLLFRESWRAKICAKCSTYFVAHKPAQLYCGTACSGGVKRERTLKWWRDKGAKRRVALAKSKPKPAGVIRGRRQR
jgi:hypothetical protein